MRRRWRENPAYDDKQEVGLTTSAEALNFLFADNTGVIQATNVK